MMPPLLSPPRREQSRQVRRHDLQVECGIEEMVQPRRPDEEISTDTLLVDRRARRAARTPDYSARPVILPVEGSGRRQRVERLATSGRAHKPVVRRVYPPVRAQERIG